MYCTIVLLLWFLLEQLNFIIQFIDFFPSSFTLDISLRFFFCNSEISRATVFIYGISRILLYIVFLLVSARCPKRPCQREMFCNWHILNTAPYDAIAEITDPCAIIRNRLPNLSPNIQNRIEKLRSTSALPWKHIKINFIN